MADFGVGLAEYGVELAAVASYQNPLDVSAQAPGIIARMNDAGVASLILVGDPLTPQTFTRTAPGGPQESDGAGTARGVGSAAEKGRWDEVDYQGVDDATEVWWDPEAMGPDENGNDGLGMYRYVDGGERYLPGEWPETRPAVFQEEDSVTIYTERPADEAYPQYPSPCA